MAGDCIELRPGDQCPVDGVVAEGSLEPGHRTHHGRIGADGQAAAGGHVLAGALNLGGRLPGPGSNGPDGTALGRVVALMQDAEQSKPMITRLLDRFAGGYLMLVVLAALLLGCRERLDHRADGHPGRRLPVRPGGRPRRRPQSPRSRPPPGAAS